MTEAYAVDETIYLDPSSATQYTGTISPAMKKTLEIGALCNNALVERNEEGLFVGQSTDVALLNVLHLVGITDRRAVSFLSFYFYEETKHSTRIIEFQEDI